jgi:peptidoglycan/xylan/chitin deacetylase (PgdA/CDA1 family)
MIFQVPGVVALTYDDGPSAYTSTILDLLDKYNGKARGAKV